MRRFAQARTSLSAARVHRPASRLYSTHDDSGHATTPTKGEERGAAAFAADEPDLNALFNFGDTLSELNHQTKTIETAVGALPISPLLDATWRKAREPRRKKKPLPFEKMCRFQRRIKQNPYAQLLAEPVRSCHATRARLPKPFLQGFGLVSHPETNELWWMPAGFEEPSKKAATNTPNQDEHVPSSEPATPQTGSPDEFAATVASEDRDGTTTGVQETPSDRPKRDFWAPAHVLARQDLLLEFLDKKSKYGGGQFRLSVIPSIGKLGGKATWRQDMHEVLRERLRRGVVDELIDVSQTCENGDRDYLVKINTPQDSLKYQNKNCFLLLTGEYKAFDYREVPNVPGTTRPVYHLPELLGAEQMQRLVSTSPLFGDDSPLRESAMILLKGKGNVELTKKLWRLQGFVANYAELK